MRELVGKKLTSGLRKDLEEIKNVRVKTALRQVGIIYLLDLNPTVWQFEANIQRGNS